MFTLVLTQTITHAFRKGGGAFGALAFYVMAVTLFTFAFGPENMAHYAGAAMNLSMLLAVVTALPLLYERDHEDGTLEQFLLQPVPLELLACAKIAGQCVAITLPILLVSPLVALASDQSLAQLVPALLRLALAAPVLVAIGSVAAALTLGAKRGGLLQALVMLPLSIPVLIFASTQGEGAVLFLTAMALAALPLSCLVSAALIRVSQD